MPVVPCGAPRELCALARFGLSVAALAVLVSCSPDAPPGAGGTTLLDFSPLERGDEAPMLTSQLFEHPEMAAGSACPAESATTMSSFACSQEGPQSTLLPKIRDALALRIPSVPGQGFGSFGQLSLRFRAPRCLAGSRVWGFYYRVRVRSLEPDRPDAAASRCFRTGTCPTFFRVAMLDVPGDTVGKDSFEPWLQEEKLPALRDERVLEGYIELTRLLHPEWGGANRNDEVLQLGRVARLELAVVLKEDADALAVRMHLEELRWVYRRGADATAGPWCPRPGAGR